MKNIIYIILFSCALSILTTSCDHETEMLFDETASQRKTAAVEQYQEVLKNSDEGWLFQYFPDKEKQYGGYSYVVKFNDNDSVAVWYEGMDDVTSPAVSFYDVISYGGPVLTFNTYNPFMHYFATPSGAEYNAKGGDYEFLLMSSEDDVITLQGTKTGNKMRLTKMTESADNYITKVKEVSAILGGGSFDATINGENVSVAEMNRNFTFQYTDNGNDTSIVVPYIVTDTGISFYEKVEIMGQMVQDFILDKENGQLISTEGDVKLSIIYSPIQFIGTYWVIDTDNKTNRSEAFMEVFTQVDEANKVAHPQYPLSKVIYLGEPFEGDDLGFVMGLGPYYIQYYLSFTGVSGHEDYLNVGKIGGGQNWQAVPHVNPLLNLIVDNAPYQVALDDAENPTGYRLTSVENPSVWFIIQ